MAASAKSVTKSNGSSAPLATTGRQMDLDGSSSSSRASATSAASHDQYLDRDLIPSTSRIARLPPEVPSNLHFSFTPPSKAAIPASQNNNTNNLGQNVHDLVNSTSHHPSSALRSGPLETSVSSLSQPLTKHGLKPHPIRRPRTSNQVFHSPRDLATQYGLPHNLPPPPRVISTHAQPVQQQHSAQPALQPTYPDFNTLCKNYINMLSKQPDDASTSSPVPVPVTNAEAAVPPTEVNASVELTASDVQNLVDIIKASPEFRDSNMFFEDKDNDFMSSPMSSYMTSPLLPELDYGASPFESPFDSFLHTPLIDINDTMMVSPNETLFNDFDFAPEGLYQDAYPQAKEPAPAPAPTTVDAEGLYKISPSTPSISTFDLFPSAVSTEDHYAARPSSSSVAPTGRRSRANGIRKGITPEALLDENAPTQPRKYTTPSQTSRKAVPEFAKRKRSRSIAFGDEDDELEDLPLNPTEEELIDHKRRQNTLAARRSRKRKLEQHLSDQAEKEEAIRVGNVWKTRAEALREYLIANGIPYPEFTAP
jgi:hypothetical protein